MTIDLHMSIMHFSSSIRLVKSIQNRDTGQDSLSYSTQNIDKVHIYIVTKMQLSTEEKRRLFRQSMLANKSYIHLTMV